MWAALLAAVSLIPAGCGSSGEKSGESRTGAPATASTAELIEDGVKDVAPDLNARLEPLLGAQLRKLIRTGAPKAAIETAVRRAKALLDRAVPALVTAE